MKKIFNTLLSLLACLLFWSASYAAAPKDIANHPYRESIQYLFDQGVVQGYPNGTYGPDREINRAEIMKIIVKSSVADSIGSWKNCFPDVQEERFSSYVCYAKENNIVKWYSDGSFKPYQNVAIAEALKMALWTFSLDIQKATWSDVWYQPYLDFVHNNTLFSKYGLDPTKNMTRWEMAYLVHQLMLNKVWTKTFSNQRAVASAGCGKEAPNTVPSSSVVNGQTRHYITVIGNHYTKDTPMKLIFAFHGRTNSNTQVRAYYDIEEASYGNAIIVYPSGLPEEGPSRNWSNPWDKASQLRDFALFDQLLKEFEDNYCINKDQIFVVGHSLGAWFTNSLSCARGDVIRAIWSVWWGTTINTCNWPVAAITMQNPDDNLSPYSAAVIARDQMLEQNHCWTKTEPYGSVGNCVKYLDCLKDAPVIWCPYAESYSSNGKYYPHVWPEYAGKTIWDFFESL